MPSSERCRSSLRRHRRLIRPVRRCRRLRLRPLSQPQIHRPLPSLPTAAQRAASLGPCDQADRRRSPPSKIPGYELRTLDRRKDVLFNVDGSWVRASVPVFVYFPTDSKTRTDGLAHVREVYQSLLNLGRKPDWTAAELQSVIANLDASIRLLEQSP